jgi:hypothetical protein
MSDLGYPQDSIFLAGKIYSTSSTIYTREAFGHIQPQRGTIKLEGDTFNPYLFLVFLEPLLR